MTERGSMVQNLCSVFGTNFQNQLGFSQKQANLYIYLTYFSLLAGILKILNQRCMDIIVQAVYSSGDPVPLKLLQIFFTAPSLLKVKFFLKSLTVFVYLSILCRSQVIIIIIYIYSWHSMQSTFAFARCTNIMDDVDIFAWKDKQYQRLQDGF